MEIGNLLFSYTIDDSLDDSEFKRMGRAIRYMNSKRFIPVALLFVAVTVISSLFVSALILVIAIIIVIELVVYMEYSARGMAKKMRSMVPIRYDFYENGLTETTSEGSQTIMYSQFKTVNYDNHNFTLVGKGSDVVVIPRSLIDKDAEKHLFDLGKVMGGRKDGRRRSLLGLFHVPGPG
jgi:hypothetical protein